MELPLLRMLAYMRNTDVLKVLGGAAFRKACLNSLKVGLLTTAVSIPLAYALAWCVTRTHLQIPLYMILMFLFFTAWGLFSGVLSSISRDFLNLVKSLTQALFWMSGILYDANGIGQQWIRNILLFNPVTIVVNGYRNALIYQKWFWDMESRASSHRMVCRTT